MAWYNITFLSEPVSIYNLFYNVNALSENLFFIYFCVVYYLIMMIAFSRYETSDILIGSSFVMTIIVALLWSIDLMAFSLVMLPVSILFLFIILKMFGIKL